MTKKYYVFTGRTTFDVPCLYVKQNGEYVDRQQLEGIGAALGERLNNRDPLVLFLLEIASGSMGLETIISGAKELLREDE